MPTLVELIEQQQGAIIARFVSEVQQQALAPVDLPRPLLIDALPAFLSELTTELTSHSRVQSSQDAGDTSASARQHGEQRWSLGYNLEALIREYGVLRHSVVEAVKDAGGAFSADQMDVLAKRLNVAVSEAVSAYVSFRDAQLDSEKANLRFLVEASELLSSSLDYRSTLRRLADLCVPRIADWCVVHLEDQSVDDMPIAHVDPSKVAAVRSVYHTYPPPSDSPHGYAAAIRNGEAELVGHVESGLFEKVAHDPEHLALLRSLDACSWLVVPLRLQNAVFGALTLVYSESKRRYAASDATLAGELARRAAIAIDNARLYQRSEEERSRVEAATRAKDEFAAVLSHELRTPLNAILGWTGLLRGGSLPEAKREHALEVIERNARAQSKLVSDLLDISGVITGKIRITPAQVDLANIVDLVVEGMRPAADAKRIQLRLELDRGSTLIRGDGERLQQVVWNLLSNAIKFTPKGGSIEVRLRRVESDIELVVADSGEGMDSALLPRVFDTFLQSDSSATRRHGGLGLGLSIASHIVELHGGSIQARSAGPGLGSTFVVRLPVAPLVSATFAVSKVPARQEERDQGNPPALQGLKVLVVDNDGDARDLVAQALEGWDIEVRLASSAREALAALASWTPDVLISDLGMPGTDGNALIRALRALPFPEKKRVPAIALSAFAHEDDRVQALAAGFDQYLSKPVELKTLLAAVAALAAARPR